MTLQKAWEIYLTFSYYWAGKKATVTNGKLHALGVALTIMKTFDYSAITKKGATADDIFDLCRASYYAYRVLNMDYKKFLVLPRIETEEVREEFVVSREGWIASLEEIKTFRDYWIKFSGDPGKREAVAIIEKTCEPTFRDFDN